MFLHNCTARHRLTRGHFAKRWVFDPLEWLMNEKHNKNPGDDDLKKFQLPGSQGPNANPKYHEDSLVTKKKGGGGGGGDAAKQAAEDREQAKPLEPASGEPYDFPTQEVPKPEEKAKEDSAVLSDAKWHADDTLFQEEAEVSVKLELPPDKKLITKVQAELFAKTATGLEPISKGEGHAQSDGRAPIILPVYKPKGYDSSPGHDGGPVEYVIKFSHKLAELFSPENILRKVTETALKAADHELVPGVSFAKNTSFIQPTATKDFKQLETTVKEWDQKYPKKAYISVFGHVDADEKDPKGLSERRAQSAHAFITNDADTWDKLYSTEKWGLQVLQVILKDLGHYHDTPNDQDGPNTHAAFKAIQKSAGLPQSGREDSGTRKAIFSAYMKGKHDIKIDASRFKNVAGHPWMGCAAHNRAKDGEGHAPENRRVTFVLLKDSKFFPVHFPCQDGNEAPCQAQCKKAGKRSGPGIGCLFYDELVREKAQPEAKDDASSKASDQVATEDFALFAATVYGESANSSEMAWRAVAHVIMNRVGRYEWSKYDSASEIVKNTGFDACTQRNQPFLKCYNYVNDKEATKSSHIGRFIEVITPIYQKKEPDNTEDSILYYSPNAQAHGHEEHPNIYRSEVPRWVNDKVKEVTIDGLLPSDDFKFYKYKHSSR